jgi:2-polyprenyl-3-methyl-5-hydroxy-6-metoxy-1,4-benzoquinol methylase
MIDPIITSHPIDDIRNLTDEEKYHLNIYHTTNDNYCKKQLSGLYGKINLEQDKDIQKSLYGFRILDVGAGNGSLSRFLKDCGYSVTSIEPHAHTRDLAKQWYNIDELPYDIYDTPFLDNSFDTIIMRECVEHLDFYAAMQEIKRICKKRVIIFQTNLNSYIEFMRLRVRHEEYNPQTLAYYRNRLKRCGFGEQSIMYRDVIAFPLSGGYQHRQLIPRVDIIENSVVKLDTKLTDLLRYTKVSKIFAWRYLLVADKITYKNKAK